MFKPKPRVFIYGAENDAQRVAELALHVGFHVIVGDWRGRLCSPERFPNAQVVVGSPREVFQTVQLDHQDYVVVMSHQLERDRDFMEELEKVQLKYPGIMSSTVRVNQLLDGLPARDWIHAPIGLPIGGKGEEEIAVSIVAE